MVRKPMIGTVALNVLTHGTGALNIDACRAGGDACHCQTNLAFGATKHPPRDLNQGPIGRWPAHVTLDEEAAAALDEQSGTRTSGSESGPRGRRAGGFVDTGAGSGDNRPNGPQYGDTGGASRFFYVAKGSRAEKEIGLDHLPKRTAGEATDREDGSAGLDNPRAGAGRTGGARNHHPTVKSIALMRWLIRLITPPGGTVLDPFAGSGTTGVAALAEGANFIGCELTDDYLPITEGRLRHALGETK